MASNIPDSSIDPVISTVPFPPNIQQIKDNSPHKSIDTESYECVFETGENISIKKSIVAKIPYFQLFFQETNGMARFKSPPKTEFGRYILPPELEPRYLKPILVYAEKGNLPNLIMNLPESDNILDLIALFDFLSMEKPRIFESSRQKKNREYFESIYRMEIGAITVAGNGKIFRLDVQPSNKCRRMAVEAGAEFCIGLAMGLIDLSTRENREKIKRRMEFILSHPTTFPRRLRNHANVIARSKIVTDDEWLMQKMEEFETQPSLQ